MSAPCRDTTKVGDRCIVDGDRNLVSPDTCVSFTPSAANEQSHLPLACATAIGDRLSPAQLAQKCYRVTLSPHGDISDDCVKEVLQAVKKTVNRYIVLEHGTSGKRHLHALLQYPEPRKSKNIADILWRVVKKHHPQSLQKCAVVINACFNLDWYEEYVRKEEDCIDVDTPNFDVDKFRDALPDEEAQAALQNAQGRKPTHNVLLAHKERWIKHAPDDATYVSAVSNLKRRINVNRDMQPIIDQRRILERTARTKVDRYRAGYAALKYAFLPCVISTSGRLHGEFLRLLYIITHRRTVNWFTRHSNDEPSEEAFKFRRRQYFWHTRAMIGQAAARAVAQRVQVAEHTLRRHRVHPHTQDDLAFPATLPSSDD